MRKAETFVRSFRSIITLVKPCEAPSDANPDTTIFNRVRMDFPPNDISGTSGCDLHNASRLGLVQIGNLVEISRKADFEDGKSTKALAFVGPAEPFINPDNGRPRHLFFDRTRSNGQSLIPIDDITNWKMVKGVLTKDETMRLGKALLNRGNESARKKMHEKNNQRTSLGTIFPH